MSFCAKMVKGELNSILESTPLAIDLLESCRIRFVVSESLQNLDALIVGITEVSEIRLAPV